MKGTANNQIKTKINMITKWYEVTCDCCGAAINHYIEWKPTKKELKADKIYCTSTHQFCDEKCYEEWKRQQHTR